MGAGEHTGYDLIVDNNGTKTIQYGADYVSAGGGINHIHLGKDDTRDVIANDNDFYTIKKSA